jgi:hypothetical protein
VYTYTFSVYTPCVSLPAPRAIINEAARHDQLLRADALGVPGHALVRAEAAGELVRVVPGIYLGASWPRSALTEAAAWTLRYPAAVAGLLTAAVHHGLTDALEQGTRLCVPIGTSVPRSRTTPIHPVQVTPRWITPEADAENGIVRVEAHGVIVRVTEPDRTVIDLWRYPRLVAREHALTALRRRVAAPDFSVPAFARLARHLDAWGRIEPVLVGMLA